MKKKWSGILQVREDKSVDGPPLVRTQREVLQVDDVVDVTFVAIEHGLLKSFRPVVIGCILRTAGGFIF